MLTPQERQILATHLATQPGLDLSQQQARLLADAAALSLRQVEYFALEQDRCPRRYARNLGTLGREGQMRLLAGNVLVAGLGGLGGYVVEQLARAGVGRIVAADHDVVEENNLNRLILATVQDVGRKKTEIARERVARINPAVEFVGLEVRFQQIEPSRFAEAGVVFDALDSGADRVALEALCEQAAVPLIHAAIGGWFGQVGVCWPGARMLEKLYRPGQIGIESRLGNPPFTPAVAASVMVTLGLQVLLGMLKPARPTLRLFDLRDGEWESVSV